MTPEQIQNLKAMLLENRKLLHGELNSIRIEESELSLKEEDGDISSYSFHLADQGTDCMFQEQSFLYAERDSRLLYMIDQALDRIEEGTYGECEICGNNIGFNRLMALPHASLCITCKANEEGLDSGGYAITDFPEF